MIIELIAVYGTAVGLFVMWIYSSTKDRQVDSHDRSPPAHPKSKGTQSASSDDGHSIPRLKFVIGLFVIAIIASVAILLTPYSPANEDRYPYSFEVTKNDTQDQSYSYRIEVTMVSPTFSAQAPIATKVKGIQLNGPDIDEIWILFVRAHAVGDYSQEYNPFIDIQLPVVNRTFSADVGPEITYRIQGCYNIEATHFHPPVRDYYKPDACSEVRIDSLTATTQWQANRLNLQNADISLKWTQIVFVYSVLAAVFTGYQVSRHQRSKTEKDNE